jgi:hypothetical protein
MENKTGKFIYWAPRILAIIFIAFLALFSLDVFGSGAGFWQTLGGLFIHNIPSLILLVVLMISWKYEIVGGVAFILAGILYVFMVSGKANWQLIFSWSLIISGPAFIIGILFIIGWIKKKNSA